MARITYRDQEENAGHHDRECGTAQHSGVDVPQKSDRERSDGGDDIGVVENKHAGDLVGGVAHAGDEDHDDEVPRQQRLLVRERAQKREEGDKEELRPPWEGLQVPREFRRAVAVDDDILHDDGCRVGETERAAQGAARIGVGDVGASDSDGTGGASGKGCYFGVCVGIKEEEELRADLQTE